MLRAELEHLGRKLRLKWFLCNDERQFDIDLFKQKSKPDPGKTNAAIKFYLSGLEEETYKKIPYSDLTKRGRNVLCSLRGDTSTIIKATDKGYMLLFRIGRTT